MTVKIRPYKNGGYEVDIMTRLANGKSYRERRKSPHSSKAASLRWGRERERHLLIHGPTRRPSSEGAAPPKKEVPTLSEFVPRFMSGYVQGNGSKPSTVDTYSRHFRVHIVPALGDLRLDELRPEDIARFKAKLSETLANKTINNILGTLSTMFHAAVDWEVIEEIPVKIKNLREVRKEMDFFNFEEFDRLAEHSKYCPIALAVIMLGGHAGLRAGEMRGLHWSSVDLETARLTVRHSEWRGQITTPKHDKNRTLPMTRRLQAALEQLPRDGELVIGQGSGVPLTRGKLDGLLHRAEARAGLRIKGPHTLRHTFCSHLAMRGAPARVIQQLAGHSNLRTTERYMHLAPGATAAAIAMLDAPPPRLALTKPSDELGEMLETER